jgi:hypothetical protein
MTIENLEVIDLFHIDASTSEAILTITDHLEWDAEHEHLFLLQNKLNSYLRFIESGELVESFPAAKGVSVIIELVCKYLPDSDSKVFLDKAATVVKDAGFIFRYRVAPHT